MTNTTVRDCITRMLRFTRAKDRLFGIGVECKGERTLTKMTDVRMRGGRLDDATCHYQHRWYVRGNTYQFRELLKGMGFRWDAGSRGWYTLDVDLTCEFMCRACRQMSQAYRAA